jgi:hypothetical protein
MNYQKLKEAEAAFLHIFPDGFSDPGMESIKKSHNVDKLAQFTGETLTRTIFHQPHEFCDTLVKIVSRSSMVSRFEKPPFRNFVESLDSTEKTRLTLAFEKRLYGRNKRQGFEEICEMLAYYKLAKWSVISAVPFYFAPRKEVFVKPTTAKGIIKYLEIENLEYKPKPTWAFYQGYRKLMMDIRKQVSPSLSPNNAALTGFLMMSG